MTKNKLFIAGVALLAAGIGSATAGLYDGDLYNETTLTTIRGAQGPIRSVDVQPTAVDIYSSLSKYQSMQHFDKLHNERGAQGPIRSESDMAMERSRDEWKKLVGPFIGTD